MMTLPDMMTLPEERKSCLLGNGYNTVRKKYNVSTPFVVDNLDVDNR